MTQWKLSALAALIAGTAAGQNLPEHWNVDLDMHRLTVAGAEHDGFYDADIVHEVRIEFAEANFWSQMNANYGTENEVHAAVIIDGETFPDAGVAFKGQTSYFMVNGDKKSFSIKLDSYVPGADVDGYKTLNLNNAFQDPSFLREFLYLRAIRKHIPAARTSFVHLYLNDEDWGLYVNVQQMNKDYLEEWFQSNDGTLWRADDPDGSSTPGGGGPGGGGPGGGGGPEWGDGTAALNYLGPDSTDYNSYYTLKSTSSADPWASLVHTCDVLNNTPIAELEAALPDVLDIDRTLWFLACENAFGDDDSYIYKGKMDYYVYWDEVTGRMVPLEYDGNSALVEESDNWGPFYHADDVNYPLLERLLQVPAYRQRYLAHLRTVLEELMDPTVTAAAIEDAAAFIDAEVAADPKKIYSYANFLTEVEALHEHFAARLAALAEHVEVAVDRPVIDEVTAETADGVWAQPLAGQTLIITAQASPANAANGAPLLTLHWSDALEGNFATTPMVLQADGSHTAELPGFPAGTVLRFYVAAAENDATGTVTYAPAGAEHDTYFLQVSPAWNPAASPVVLNEVMAKNATAAADEAGEYDDWIELYNAGTTSVDLTGWYLTDNPWNVTKWPIPSGTMLEPDAYLMVWADEDGAQGPFHANFKLDADGETLWLLDPSGQISNDVTWPALSADASYARVPNGTGPFTVQGPTFSANNETVGIAEARPHPALAGPNPAPAGTWISGPSDFLSVRATDAAGRSIACPVAGNQWQLPTMPGHYLIVMECATSQWVRHWLVMD